MSITKRFHRRFCYKSSFSPQSCIGVTVCTLRRTPRSQVSSHFNVTSSCMLIMSQSREAFMLCAPKPGYWYSNRMNICSLRRRVVSCLQTIYGMCSILHLLPSSYRLIPHYLPRLLSHSFFFSRLLTHCLGSPASVYVSYRKYHETDSGFSIF